MVNDIWAKQIRAIQLDHLKFSKATKLFRQDKAINDDNITCMED